MMSGNFRETHTLLTSCMRLPVYPVNPEIEVRCQVLKISVQVQVCWRALSHSPSQLWVMHNILPVPAAPLVFSRRPDDRYHIATKKRFRWCHTPAMTASADFIIIIQVISRLIPSVYLDWRITSFAYSIFVLLVVHPSPACRLLFS